MKTRIFIACLALFLMSPVLASGKVLKSTAEDRTKTEITIYSSNLGLIKETRRLKIPAGRGELLLMDVASRLMPETAHARSLSFPGDFTILEQSYDYDLVNQKKLLDKYVGKKIKIVDFNPYKNTKREIEAVLLSNNDGPVYRIGDEIYLGHPGVKVLPGIPEDLVIRPTLTWLYENENENEHALELSYLSTGLTWKADHTMILHPDETSSDISSLVTIDNRSGTSFRNAGLKLIAGDISREKNRAVPERAMALIKADAPAFEEKTFFEYHLYTLDRKSTIKNNQTKQLTLFEAKNAGVKKEFLVTGQGSAYRVIQDGNKKKVPVNIFISLLNTKKNNLGIPFPAGIVRLYKRDSQGSLQLIGENRIGHISREEEIRLKAGKAFDITAERSQTDFKKLTKRLSESEWEITLRNHKKEDIVVGVVEKLSGSWEIIDKTAPYKKIDARTIRFDVRVKRNGEAKIRYRVKTGY